MSLNTPSTMDGQRYARFSRRLKAIVRPRRVVTRLSIDRTKEAVHKIDDVFSEHARSGRQS
jgi:hypothetical protein